MLSELIIMFHRCFILCHSKTNISNVNCTRVKVNYRLKQTRNEKKLLCSEANKK